MRRALALALWLALPALARAQGLLVPDDRGIPPLAIRYHRVAVEIREQAAVTEITQAFVNHTPRVLEATYLFPVPKGAAVGGFQMTVNGKKVQGEILEQDRARAIYRDIVRRMRDPGLLEHLGENLFQARVFPIAPGAQQEIAITLNQVVPCDAGVCTYTYPLALGERAGRTEQDFTLSARIESRTPIKSVYSPTHRVAVQREGDRRATVGLEEERALLARDFTLIYTLSAQDVGVSVLSTRPADQDGFFLLLVSPKADAARAAMPKDVTFVLDTSGSMSGEKIESARRALLFCIEHLSPDDRFNVVRFATDVSRMNETLVHARPDNLRQAKDFIRRFEALGGTNLDEALTVGLAPHEDRRGRPQIVVFLTDGKATVGETSAGAIAEHVRTRNRAGVRLFVFGVGTDVDAVLLDRLARENGGTATYIAPGQEIELALSSFYSKIASPVMSDLSLSLSGADAYDLYPPKLPDLFAGDQLVLLGRYRRPGKARVTLTGAYEDQTRIVEGEAHLADGPENRGFIEKLWATRKIGFLLEEIRIHGENRELVDEIVKLSTTYGIVTPYTSYLIAEEPKERPTPAPVDETILRHRGERRPSFGGDEDTPAAKAAPMPEAGAGAVQTSQALRAMKESAVTRGAEEASVRRVDGRTFTRDENGVWTDSAYREGFEVRKIRYLSDAYFLLVELRPDLVRALALGEKILLVVGNRRAILVSDQGEEKMERAELERYIKQPGP